MARMISEVEPLPQWTHQLIADLSAETGETASIVAPAGVMAVFIDVVESQAAIRYFATIGHRVPIHATASGRSLLLQYSQEERDSIYRKIEFKQYGPSTPISIEAVETDGEVPTSNHDMGGDIVPAFVRRQQAAVYDYKDNDVPGSTDRDRGYWRDVGTIGSFYAAQMDVVSPLPVFNLYNFDWPIYTSYGPQPPAKLVQGATGDKPSADEAVLSPGVVITGGTVRRSVLSPSVRVETGAEVTGSVLMNGVSVGAGAVVRNAILDKHVVIPPGAQVGVDPEADLARGFVVEDGLTVLGKDQPFPA